MIDETAKKQAGGRRRQGFQPGQSGNPAGRPSGLKNRATLILDQLANGEAEGLFRNVLTAAQGGDLRAAEIILNRIWPARKGRPVDVELPEVKSPADVVSAIGALLQATAKGDLTPEEASIMAGILENKRKAIEMVELDERIARLEARQP